MSRHSPHQSPGEVRGWACKVKRSASGVGGKRWQRPVLFCRPAPSPWGVCCQYRQVWQRGGSSFISGTGGLPREVSCACHPRPGKQVVELWQAIRIWLLVGHLHFHARLILTGGFQGKLRLPWPGHRVRAACDVALLQEARLPPDSWEREHFARGATVIPLSNRVALSEYRNIPLGRRPASMSSP